MVTALLRMALPPAAQLGAGGRLPHPHGVHGDGAERAHVGDGGRGGERCELVFELRAEVAHALPPRRRVQQVDGGGGDGARRQRGEGLRDV